MNKFAHQKTQRRALASARLALAASVLALLSALVFAPGQQSASAAPPATASKRHAALLPAGQRPNFVVIQTDDQTLDQLYATYTPPGGGTITAMPNTLASIAGKGITFNRYYVSYPLCCPSRVSLLTGRYAHNHNDRGNVPPEGGY
ncbi:MAG TPA: sulfatase-like hydrolase/transferase, partial [Solirubrobacterales bacterium]|nr:sulfatase-like hydrolase/transferase [Solirubrobacterales bacterium]